MCMITRHYQLILVSSISDTGLGIRDTMMEGTFLSVDGEYLEYMGWGAGNCEYLVEVSKNYVYTMRTN